MNIGARTNACLARGIPFVRTVLSTSRANTWTWMPTVGIPYFDSMSITWPETSGAQPGQVPTPMIAASPSAATRSQSSGSGLCWSRQRTTSVRIPGS